MMSEDVTSSVIFFQIASHRHWLTTRVFRIIQRTFSDRIILNDSSLLFTQNDDHHFFLEINGEKKIIDPEL